MDPQLNQNNQVGNDFSPQNAAQPQLQPQLQPSTPQPQPQMYGPQPQQIVQFPAMAEPQPKRKGFKLKLAAVCVLASLLLFGGSAAAYVQVVVNSPENVWERAMSSTSKGLDAISQSYSESKDKPKKLDATFKATSPFTADGSLHMMADEKNASMTLDAGAAGTRLNGEVRLIDSGASDYPDIYFQVKGLNAIGSLLGFGGGDLAQLSELLNSADGQWYSVDHTLLDQMANQAGSSDSKMPELSQDDLNKIAEAFMGVTKNDLLSTDANKAVFEVAKKVGKEDFEGTSTYRYEVAVNKDHLKAFLTDLKTSLGTTKLSDVVAGVSGKSYNDAINLDEIFRSIDSQDFSNAKADVWAEASGRYIRNIRIYPVADSKDKNYLDIGLPYKGGDIIPLVIKATIDEDGSKGTVTSGLEYNKANSEMHGYANFDVTDTDQTVKLEYDYTVKNAEAPKVTVPDGAKNAMELLGLFSGSSSTGIDDFTSANPNPTQEEIDALMNQYSIPRNDDVQLQ